jgi:hypothetical protein
VDRELCQEAPAFGCQADFSGSAIGLGAFAADHACGFEAVDQAYHAVMAEAETFGEVGDVSVSGLGRFNGEHELVLLRLDPGFVGYFFAKAKKTADLVTEFGQSMVFTGGDLRHYLYRNTI